MIGALTDQLALPFDTTSRPEPATVAGSPCCPAPYCSGCTSHNYLSPDESDRMRGHLRRLLGRPRTRQVTA
jgi:hypothetical protein